MTGKAGVHFTADGEFRELLERVRGLAGHRLPGGELMTLLKRGLAPSAPGAPSEAELSAPDLPKPEVSTPRSIQP